MTDENGSNDGKIESAAEGSNLLDGVPLNALDREGIDVESTQSKIGAEASFTFAQIEAACNVLRAYGAECIAADQYGVGDPSEIDSIREIASALGLGL